MVGDATAKSILTTCFCFLAFHRPTSPLLFKFMFTTLMIGNDAQSCDTIRGTIEEFCRDIEFHGMATDLRNAPTRGNNAPDLIFWDSQGNLAARHVAADSFPSGVINVLLLDQPLPARPTGARTIWASVHTCLYKPLQVPDLLITLSNGKSMVELRKAFQNQQDILERIMERQNNPEIVGIPTEEGMEFLPAKEIVRCEGLNKYTMILTRDNAQLVSSYNIGEFAKILHAYGFFSPHKSHLINLRCIRRLTNENQIVLHDGSQVPLSRRRKLEFVQRFRGENG
jgi:two-component system, LytTR family, response regulator